MASPITGGDGNVEFLLHVNRALGGMSPDAWSARRDAAVATAEEGP